MEEVKNNPINAVWLKRNLRLKDHAPLASGWKACIPMIILYFFEPELITRPDVSRRHLRFYFHSIQDMNAQLKPIGHRYHVMQSDAVEAFTSLQKHYEIRQVFSHRESGTKQTWERDKEVAKYLKVHGTIWHQFS